VLTFVVGVMASMALLATPAMAATPTYDCAKNQSNDICQKQFGIGFWCVWKNTNGTYTGEWVWGNSSNTYDIVVAKGPANQFTPAPADRGQPATFAHYNWGAVLITWNGSPLTWQVAGHSATGSSSSTKCKSPPVPMFDNWRLTAAVVLLLLPITVFTGRSGRLTRLLQPIRTRFRETD
jgi:hypothetical protein